MNNYFFTTKVKIIFVILIVVIISFIIFLFFYTQNSVQTTTSPDVTPTASVANNILTPTTRPGGGPQPDIDYFEIDEATYNKNQALGNLLSILPFSGENFSLDYSYSEFTYILTISQANKELGDLEFNNFLKQNNIENSSWLENLRISYY